MDYRFRAWDKKRKIFTNQFVLAPTSPTWGAFPIENPDEKLVMDLRSFDERQGTFVYSDFTLTDWSNYYGLDEYVVLRYSSWKDRNGADICQGDILDVPEGWSGDYNEKRHLAVVEQDEDDFMFYFSRSDSVSPKDCTIVGNIYENPTMIDFENAMTYLNKEFPTRRTK